ncbi:hypothetical protein LCGC14_1202760 [marine sediment metagenome]|uniref:HicB-like antitoxin of toxin-antitoxin system domain-containing protein n=1 Tax=marine sediment metagenome TaxID=412755 RepID=A0A0F9LKV3_9ZZZZ
MEIQTLSWAVYQDETTDGGTCFVCKDLDLDGCMGQGQTSEEAVADWVGARAEFLASMREDGISVSGYIDI